MSLHYFKLLLLSTEDSSIMVINDYFKNARYSNLLCYLLKIAEINGIQIMRFASKLCITPPTPPQTTQTNKQTDKKAQKVLSTEDSYEF